MLVSQAQTTQHARVEPQCPATPFYPVSASRSFVDIRPRRSTVQRGLPFSADHVTHQDERLTTTHRLGGSTRGSICHGNSRATSIKWLLGRDQEAKEGCAQTYHYHRGSTITRVRGAFLGISFLRTAHSYYCQHMPGHVKVAGRGSGQVAVLCHRCVAVFRCSWGHQKKEMQT